MRRILIVADDGERAALLEKAIYDAAAPRADDTHVRRVTALAEVPDAVDGFDPGVVLVDLGGAASFDELARAALDLAIGRHAAISRLEAELDKARGALRDRALIDRAKALLMERKRLTESEAYALLRRTAMSTNRRIVDLARSIVEASALISDEPAGGSERE